MVLTATTLVDPARFEQDRGETPEEHRIGGRELHRDPDAPGNDVARLPADRPGEVGIEREDRLLVRPVPDVRTAQIDLDGVDVE